MDDNKAVMWVEKELFRLTQAFKRMVKEMEKVERQIAKEENNGKKKHKFQHGS